MIIPAMRYRDTEAALRFLTEVFGLTQHAVYRDDAGAIIHAQLMHAGGMVMVGPAGGGVFDSHLTHPSETGGRATVTVYLVEHRIGALYEQVRQGGAAILIPLKDEDHGGQSFTATDPEGHIWTFGSYDPLAPNVP